MDPMAITTALIVSILVGGVASRPWGQELFFRVGIASIVGAGIWAALEMAPMPHGMYEIDTVASATTGGVLVFALMALAWVFRVVPAFGGALPDELPRMADADLRRYRARGARRLSS